MKILDSEKKEKLKNIILYLTKEEAIELRDSIEELIESDSHQHTHIPSEDYKNEITVCIYNIKNLKGFDEDSKRIILDN